jgi:hypothetical protein
MTPSTLASWCPRPTRPSPSASRSPRRPDGGHRGQLGHQLTIPELLAEHPTDPPGNGPWRCRRGPFTIRPSVGPAVAPTRQGSRPGHPALKRSMLSIVHGADCFGVRAQDVEADSRYPLVGCQKSVGCHAARSYSCMRPPRTSPRRSRHAAADRSPGRSTPMVGSRQAEATVGTMAVVVLDVARQAGQRWATGAARWAWTHHRPRRQAVLIEQERRP